MSVRERKRKKQAKQQIKYTSHGRHCCDARHPTKFPSRKSSLELVVYLIVVSGFLALSSFAHFYKFFLLLSCLALWWHAKLKRFIGNTGRRLPHVVIWWKIPARSPAITTVTACLPTMDCRIVDGRGWWELTWNQFSEKCAPPLLNIYQQIEFFSLLALIWQQQSCAWLMKET